jgi:hypothetical protein
VRKLPPPLSGPVDFMLVYQPNQAFVISHSRRFLVSFRTLHKYIGKKNANKAIREALILKLNKRRLRFRKFGIVDIYLK